MVSGQQIYQNSDLQEACESMGGEFSEPNEGVWVCENNNGDAIVMYEGGPEVDIYSGDSDSPDWTGETFHLRAQRSIENASRLILSDAQGNPGPPGPMYVDDAKVSFEPYGVYAERTQQL